MRRQTLTRDDNARERLDDETILPSWMFSRAGLDGWEHSTWREPVEDEAALCASMAGVPGWAAARFAQSRAARALGIAWDDLTQIAWLGVLRGVRTWREDGRMTLHSWCCTNALFPIRRALAKVYDKWNRLGRCAELMPVSQMESADDQSIWEKLEVPMGRDDARSVAIAAATHALGILRARHRYREADVLEMRVLDGRTLQEIGDLMGVTRERIRQIEAKAVSRLAEISEWRQYWEDSESVATATGS